ncbi:thioredoxin family protein [Microbacterium sp. NPDC076895]|uniref:thioredoxin family protein n=1 Tax=Microbacterium sp. NPDC076895 TaxID=3154957 RepID=UPI003416ABA1
MTGVAELTSSQQVHEAIAGSPHVLVEMWGTHCAPCRSLRPILERMAGEHDDWSFNAINVEAIDGIADEFGVRGTPTILLYQDGVEKTRTNGFVMPNDLIERMSEAAAR